MQSPRLCRLICLVLPPKVAEYYSSRRTWAKMLESAGLFIVFSPWLKHVSLQRAPSSRQSVDKVSSEIMQLTSRCSIEWPTGLFYLSSRRINLNWRDVLQRSFSLCSLKETWPLTSDAAGVNELWVTLSEDDVRRWARQSSRAVIFIPTMTIKVWTTRILFVIRRYQDRPILWRRWKNDYKERFWEILCERIWKDVHFSLRSSDHVCRWHFLLLRQWMGWNLPRWKLLDR